MLLQKKIAFDHSGQIVKNSDWVCGRHTSLFCGKVMKPKKPGFLSSVLDSLISTVEASVREALEQAAEGEQTQNQVEEAQKKPSAVTSVIKNLVEALQKNGHIEVHYEVKSTKPHLDVASEQPKLSSNLQEISVERAPDSDEGTDALLDLEPEVVPPQVSDQGGLKIEGSICIGYQGSDKCVVVPEGVTHIANSAFKYHQDIEEIVLPGSLIAIGPYAFKGCKNLKSIVLPWNVQTIETEAFAGCSSLKFIELPESICSLSKYLFMCCSALEYVGLPRNLEVIPEGMFAECYSLERIRWPQSLSNIEKHAFRDCYDSDVWTYYVLEDGEMRRMRADPNELDPEHIFYLPQAPFVQSCIYNLLDMIHVDTMHLPDLATDRLSIFQKALKFCRILTADDTYAVSQMIEMTRHVLFAMMPEDMDSGKSLEALLYMTAEAVGGSGQAYKLAEKAMYDIYKLRYQNSKNYQEAIKNSVGKALNLFGAELTPSRYNPMVWHHTASFSSQWDYLNFVFRMEGLLRGIGVEVTQLEAECDEDNSLEEWLSAWSTAISSYGLVILDLKAPQMADKAPDHVFSITTAVHADMILDLFKSYHCDHLIDCWNSGNIGQSGLHFV